MHRPKLSPGVLAVVAALILWAAGSTLSALSGRGDIFSAMGAFLLSLGFVIFLTERHRTTELRRLWDSQVEVQLRMIWRYVRRLRPGHDRAGPPQHSLDEMERILDDSFEDLMAAKNAERRLDGYRIEMALSIAGTLQWGFGEIVIAALHR
jgi:hypothetical protein